MSPWDKDTGTSGTLRLIVSVTQSGNSSTVHATLQVIVRNSLSHDYNGTGVYLNIGGGANHNDSFTFSGTGTYTVASWSKTFAHDSRGYHGNVTVTGHMNDTGTSGVGGPTSVAGTVSLPRIPKTPTAPRSFTVTVTGRDAALHWIAPSDNGGASISDYVVQYSTGSGWTGTHTTTGTTYTYSSLPPGTYEFRVYARNAIGNGATAVKTGIDIHAGGKISVGGAWKFGMVKVSVGGAWKEAIVKVSSGGVWKDAL